MLIYIIRHGETDYNIAGKLQGWLDVPLNTNGRKLAVITGKALKDIHFDVCYTSPFARAKETAQLVLQHSGNEYVPIYDDLRLLEMNFGTCDGLCCRHGHYELPLPRKTVDLLFKDAFSFPGFPKGENIKQLCKRAKLFLLDVIRQPALQDKTVLISTHGCTVRALLQMVYSNPRDFWHGGVPDNCTVNILECCDGRLTLVADDKIYYDPDLCKNMYLDAGK